MFPLKMNILGITYDSMSFKNIDITKDVEIPVGNHVGAFGTERRFDIHKGVDLYCPSGAEVYSIEDGKIVQIRWFTGKNANCDWWNDTQAISVEGKSGVVVYGEVLVNENLKEGDKIKEGQPLGVVERVLKHDKGRPTSMLHFALHHNGILRNGIWEKDKSQPIGLLDPTNLLIRKAFI